MRIRSLKPGFFKNEQLAELSPWHRLCYEGLWCYADREGRMEDRPKRLKAEIFPYDDLNMDALLWDLNHAGFIRHRFGGDRTVRFDSSGFRHSGIGEAGHGDRVPARVRPMNGLDKISRHLKRHRRQWVSAITLARLGGWLSSRTRISECRTLLGMDVQNRTTLVGQGQRKRSEYLYRGRLR